MIRSLCRVHGRFASRSEEKMFVFCLRYILAVVLALAITTLSAAQNIKVVADSALSVSSPARSPDGRTLAFEWQQPDYSLGIYLRPFSGGQAIPFVVDRDAQEGFPTSPRWSPDGKEIAFLRVYCAHCDDEIVVKSYPRGSEHRLGKVCQSSISWTPDGRFLIAAEPTTMGSEECHIVLIPVDGAPRTKLVPSGAVAALSPDGKRLAYAVGNRLMLANLTAGFRIAGGPTQVASEPHEISSIRWQPDGKALIYQVWSDGQYYSKLVSTEGNTSVVNLSTPVETSKSLRYWRMGTGWDRVCGAVRIVASRPSIGYARAAKGTKRAMDRSVPECFAEW